MIAKCAFVSRFCSEFQKLADWWCSSCHSNITDHCFRDNKRIENEMSSKIVARLSKQCLETFLMNYQAIRVCNSFRWYLFWWIKSIHSYGSFNHVYFSFSQQWYLIHIFFVLCHGWFELSAYIDTFHMLTHQFYFVANL